MAELAELVFIPSPGAGHLTPMVELAKLVLKRHAGIAISIFIIKFPDEPAAKSDAAPVFSSDSDRLRFVDVPRDEPGAEITPVTFLSTFFDSQKPYVRDTVKTIEAGPGRVVGFVLDMFCTAMIDVADEFGVPAYMFYTSSAMFYHVSLHCQDNGIKPGADSDTGIVVPGISKPVPARATPTLMLGETVAALLEKHLRKMRKSKGVIFNTFPDLESSAIQYLSASTGAGFLPVYPVGPIVSLNRATDRAAEILSWLDEQPPSLVVFLCFGSRGSFGEDQLAEIARALEQTGVRFLWSIRKPPQRGMPPSAGDYPDPAVVLPEGFLDRTAGRGKVIGWAPQVDILAHAATGGFVSHCGWNSTLESLWFGVPMATWPLYAEQKFNAFELVEELGLAVEITMDYRTSGPDGGVLAEELVSAEAIARGVEKLMEAGGEVRERVKRMSHKSRASLLEGGSSPASVSAFIEDVLHAVPKRT